jgi:hypothetical protein
VQDASKYTAAGGKQGRSCNVPILTWRSDGSVISVLPMIKVLMSGKQGNGFLKAEVILHSGYCGN